MYPPGSASYTSYIQSLKKLGMKALMTWDGGGYFGSFGVSQISGTNWIKVGDQVKQYQPVIDSVEVSNEPDMHSWQTWPNPPALRYQGNAWPWGQYYQTCEMANILVWNGIAGVKTCGVPVAATKNYTAAGNFFGNRAPGLAACNTNWDVVGNAHMYPDYPAGTPDTCWGSSGTGGIAGAVQDIRSVIGTSRPIYCGETGYNTGWTGLNTTVQCYFEPLLYVEHFRQGIERTYLYELYDSAYDPQNTNEMAHWGLVSMTASGGKSPKPAFWAIANLMSIVKDTNPATFTPASPLYSITGWPAHHPKVNYLVLESSSRKDWFVLIWNNKTIWNNNAVIPPSTQTSTVTIATTVNRTITAFAPSDFATGGAIFIL